MKYTQKVIAQKTTGDFRLAVVERTYENGRVTYGTATCRKGKKWSEVACGYSKKQALSIHKHHHASSHSPDILVYG